MGFCILILEDEKDESDWVSDVEYYGEGDEDYYYYYYCGDDDVNWFAFAG